MAETPERDESQQVTVHDSGASTGGHGNERSEENPPNEKPSAVAHIADIVTAATKVVWLILGVILFFMFSHHISPMLTALTYRVQAGGQLKIGTLELQSIKVSGDSVSTPSNVVVVPDESPDSIPDGIEELQTAREEHYKTRKNVMIVHRLYKSTDPNQLYDIQVYLVPHDSPSRSGSLASIRRVEYYFGGMWGKRVFRSDDRSNGFPVVVSAYGPMLCTARVYYSAGAALDGNAKLKRDSDYDVLFRYIDFEMGKYAPIQEPEHPSAKSRG